MIDERTPRKPLRLWPGVVLAVLLCAARFGVKAVIPGFGAFALGMQATFFAAAAVLLWWLLFSRAAWLERLGALVLMPAGLGAAWYLRHESMGPVWLLGWAIPFLCVAFVAWAVATRRLEDGPRRATMVATIALACGVWMLARMEGITGDHVAQYAWRWTPTAEEQLLARSAGTPVARAAEPTPQDTPAERPVAPTADTPAVAAPAPAAPAPDAPPTSAGAQAPAAAPPAAEVAMPSTAWPGFRGPRRDAVVPGVRIATDWSASPPVELWRRAVGPGWSSFAVRGNLLYTQEQRGDHEVVACYDVTTGQPAWSHRDPVRFFEANGGAGPRATPTLDGDRVYTLGATGILNALAAADGAVAWSRNVASDTSREVPTWGFSSSPLVVDDVVIVAAAGQLVAYDRATGRLRWSGAQRRHGYSSPQLLTIGGVPQVLLASNAGTTSVAPSDGVLLWEHAWPGSPIVQPAVTPEGDVLVATAESGTRRLAVARGPEGWTVQERWTSTGLKPYFNDFVVHEGQAFGFDARILASIDLEDGTRNWKGGRYGNGQLVLLPDQDLLLVLSEDGELALVSATPDRFSELGRFAALQGKTWNHPVLVGDVLLVRNGEEMAAFRLALAGR